MINRSNFQEKKSSKNFIIFKQITAFSFQYLASIWMKNSRVVAWKTMSNLAAPRDRHVAIVGIGGETVPYPYVRISTFDLAPRKAPATPQRRMELPATNQD